ncbi:MAG: hypothetical protein KGL56_07390 [Alphaproteobacteria bacterium]|nr:hypothetical protein [Alphaproteobacteria bacterium]MDE2500001.1 hypothetical protein [Alphaproteobacteria bacterium]
MDCSIRPVDDAAKPAPVGHNGGPPLDVSWNAWVWRRAHAEAWRPPGREIVLLRLRRAARLGLGYRDYTAVILDRGVHLSGLIVVMPDERLASEQRVLCKLESLSDCHIAVCASSSSDMFSERVRKLGGYLAAMPDDETLPKVIKDLVVRSQFAPSALFLVGTVQRHRQIAERAGLGLFVDARRYFELTV